MRGLFLAAVLGLLPGPAWAQSPSVLTLERPTVSRAPFQKGDHLEIRNASLATEDARLVIVLNVQWWPWVEVQTLTGKNWLNFSNVAAARFTKTPE